MDKGLIREVRVLVREVEGATPGESMVAVVMVAGFRCSGGGGMMEVVKGMTVRVVEVKARLCDEVRRAGEVRI